MEPPGRPVKAIRLEDHNVDGSHRVVIRSEKGGDVVLTHKKPWQVHVKSNRNSATASFAVFIAEENFKSSDAFWRDACPDFFRDVNYMGQFLALDFIALCIARGESDRLGGNVFELEWMTFKNVATGELLAFPSTGSAFFDWTRKDTERAFRIAANIQGPDSDEGDCRYKSKAIRVKVDGKSTDTKVKAKKRKLDEEDQGNEAEDNDNEEGDNNEDDDDGEDDDDDNDDNDEEEDNEEVDDDGDAKDREEKNAVPTWSGDSKHLLNYAPIARGDMERLEEILDWQQVSYRGKLLDRQKAIYSLVKSNYHDFDGTEALYVREMPEIIEKYRVICQKEEKACKLNHCVATLLPRQPNTVMPKDEDLKHLEEQSRVYFMTVGAECQFELVATTSSSKKEFLLKSGDLLILGQSILGKAKLGITGRMTPGGNTPRIVLAFRSVKQVGKK